MDTLQTWCPISRRWKSNPLHRRSCRTKPQISTHPPTWHCAIRGFACGRLRRSGCLPSLTAPVLRNPHIRIVQIWKTRTCPAFNSHAVLPRIPTSPQQTTTAAIYTYLLIYFVVAVADGYRGPCPQSAWRATTGSESRKQNREKRIGRFAPPERLPGTARPDFPRNVQLSTPPAPVKWSRSVCYTPAASLV